MAIMFNVSNQHFYSTTIIRELFPFTRIPIVVYKDVKYTNEGKKSDNTSYHIPLS